MAGWGSVDSTTVLGENDHREVILAVADLTGEWMNLGIFLGLHQCDLNTISTANPKSPRDCLREMLSLWLKQNYDVKKYGKPTWRKLVEAVQNKVGGYNHVLAQKIAAEHRGVPNTIYNLPQYIRLMVSNYHHLQRIYSIPKDECHRQQIKKDEQFSPIVTVVKLVDKKHRKLESQQQSRLHPEKGHTSTDPTDIFSIRVMVSNYQPLQTIFSIPEGECHTRPIKTDEQFSPIVTIVDAATTKPLDCVLLLQGEQSPQVDCKKLFCYIEVKVSVSGIIGHDYCPCPLYHVKRKPCKQGKLPLIFCFHQPGTVCVIQLSIYSIVDSEGVEYMHHSEDCTCVVEIIDRDEHGEVKMKDQHGVVRTKEPPLLRYTGPLATKKYHNLERLFTKFFRNADYKQVQQLSKLVIVKSSNSPDIKVFALCWEGLCLSIDKEYELAEKLLKTAWNEASKLEGENSLLLQGRTLRHLAHLEYAQAKDVEALNYLSQANDKLFHAAPSEETAHALYTKLLLKKRRFFSIPNSEFSSQLLPFEKECEELLKHAVCMEEYEKPAHSSFFTMKASFHLRSDLITDKLPPEEYWPSPDDLRKAEECLKSVPLDIMCQSDLYKARYFCSCCDLYIWKQEYHNAMSYLEEARKLSKKDSIYQRLQLIETLKEDDNIDEIATQDV